MPIRNPLSVAALSVLLVLQLTMLGAMFSGTEPHPPLTVAPFAIAPFLGAAISMAVAAIVLGGTEGRRGAIASTTAAVLSLVSFGPQKWVDPSISLIWPAVLLGQLAALTLLVLAVRHIRSASSIGPSSSVA